jgi:hypothetical protein
MAGQSFQSGQTLEQFFEPLYDLILGHISFWDLWQCMYNRFLGLADGMGVQSGEHSYSGLQKRCNILLFQIVCSVALYGMEITLRIIERK